MLAFALSGDGGLRPGGLLQRLRGWGWGAGIRSGHYREAAKTRQGTRPLGCDGSRGGRESRDPGGWPSRPDARRAFSGEFNRHRIDLEERNQGPKERPGQRKQLSSPELLVTLQCPGG